MSRSVHTTHKQLLEARRRSYRDAKVQAAEVDQIKRDLSQKRAIKDAVGAERRSPHLKNEGALGGPVPIRVIDSGPHILHPATPDDLEAIRKRLPAGVTDGLSEIVLGLGTHAQREDEYAYAVEPDPVAGRVGMELMPGFYSGLIWGTYDSSTCRIDLFALVSDTSKPSQMPTTVYLKLQCLATFVHEIAHHADHTERVARGRWLANETEKLEHFADQRQQEWTQTYVVPYLEEAYSQDVAELLGWLEAHGRVRFTLGELTPDPRRAYVSNIHRAVADLVTDVANKTGRMETIFRFAVNLTISDMYERAQEVIDHILAEAPGHEVALELRAYNWICQERFTDAAELAEQLLARNPRFLKARLTLTRAYEGLQQWETIIGFTTESLRLFEDEYDLLDARASRCLAYWKLGRFEESNDDLKVLQAFERARSLVKWILRKRGTKETGANGLAIR
jgi:tetratricopeptide (TPR) repeat protein